LGKGGGRKRKKQKLNESGRESNVKKRRIRGNEVHMGEKYLPLFSLQTRKHLFTINVGGPYKLGGKGVKMKNVRKFGLF